jgi:hypothetical protein
MQKVDASLTEICIFCSLCKSLTRTFSDPKKREVGLHDQWHGHGTIAYGLIVSLDSSSPCTSLLEWYPLPTHQMEHAESSQLAREKQAALTQTYGIRPV